MVSERKVITAGCLTLKQRDSLEKLNNIGYIKSLSAGVRAAVSEWLRSPEQKQKLIEQNQKKITDYGD